MVHTRHVSVREITTVGSLILINAVEVHLSWGLQNIVDPKIGD